MILVAFSRGYVCQAVRARTQCPLAKAVWRHRRRLVGVSPVISDDAS